MKEPKIKRYRLGVSQNFPTTHPKKGKETNFVEKINAAIVCRKKCYGECEMCANYRWLSNQKIHTCRANYQLWEKRIKEVHAGRAVIELFYWNGKPYNSQQVVFATLDKDSGCGVQRLNCDDYLYSALIDGVRKEFEHIPKNDGLSYEDFEAWFKGYDLSKPMAIIQFTKFRY